MNAASFSSGAGGGVGGKAMWYCFAIDETTTSVDEVHRLWRRRHRGAWHRALRLNDVAEDAVRSHAAVDASAWWQRYGAGAVVIRPGEDGLDAAVCAFLLEHAESFSRVWYGAVTRSPAAQRSLPTEQPSAAAL